MDNLFTAHELEQWLKNLSRDFTLGDCLFVVVKLTENADFDKYGHYRYGMCFDAHSFFSINGEFS